VFIRVHSWLNFPATPSRDFAPSRLCVEKLLQRRLAVFVGQAQATVAEILTHSSVDIGM